MKLIYCPVCGDIRRLTPGSTFCSCACSSGGYEQDGLNAWIEGDAIPLGINNTSFYDTLNKYPFEGERGERFDAFLIPSNCDTVKVRT